MSETRGIIMFNRGTGCLIRAMVCLHTLRKYWSGPVTFYLEDTPKEFDDVCKYFNADIIHNKFKPEYKTLIRKTDMFTKSPYDKTLWLDADMVIAGKLDEMFEYLVEADCAIPHFANWWSDGHRMKIRINDFKGIADDKYIERALGHYPAVNTGILSWKKSDNWNRFAAEWVKLADKGNFFISDEKAFQVLYPSSHEWGLSIYIAPTKFNVSVLHDHGLSKDVRVWHFHGKKHVLDIPNCDIWKDIFLDMKEKDIANINSFLGYDHRRTKAYIGNLGKEKNMDRDDPARIELAKKMADSETDEDDENNMEEAICEKFEDKKLDEETTIVTACDAHYLEILRETFPNWRRLKNIDNYPVTVFINGIDLDDERLEFLNLPNVRLIPWDLQGCDNQREKMLSAFVLGTAEHITTPFWLKLDADSFATDSRPFITDEMKKYSFCGHRWGYSRPEHIVKLDNWAKNHENEILRNSSPMILEGRIEGRRFYHNTKRTISFIQLHSTEFTKFCVSLLSENRLPAPTQDTFMYFVAKKFYPDSIGIMNFKKNYGFMQGKGKLGADHFRSILKNYENN